MRAGTLLLVVLAALPHSGVGASSATSVQGLACPVTAPNRVFPSNDLGLPTAYSYGTEQLAVFSLWPEGTVVFKPGGAGFVERDDALSMKFPWVRGVRGRLEIKGRRLDADGPPLRAEILDGYGDTGFQVTRLIFPTSGCWEVTGSAGNASITFVTRVVKIGRGPSDPRLP